jgi:hypothetical protein
MKKYFNFYFIGIIIITGLLTGSCEKNKDNDAGTDNCDKLTEAYINTYQAFIADLDNKEKCENFANAAHDLINNCAILTPEQKQEYLDQYNALKCAELDN